MSKHDLPFPLAATFFIMAACCRAAPAGATPCAAFEAAGVPFFACASNDGPGALRLSAGGQTSVGGLRLEDESGPFFLLSMDYEAGDHVGAWTAATGFVLTLRWDGAGPRRDVLAAEFCAPWPVPVRLHFEGPPEPRTCGQWATLLEGVAFPAAATAARRRH